MTKRKISVLFRVIFVVGLIILLYPFVSQYWNSRVQSKVITDYDEIFNKKEKCDYSEVFLKADNYNQQLLKLDYPLIQYEEIPDYNNLLDVSGNGMMGYITIDKIGVEIPIYHGTSSSILNVAVGHLNGTSLPVGGMSTHSVLSAHSGLPSAKLFTNLNKLEIGDTFVITIIDRKITYQIDNIVIVKPDDISNLGIEEGHDYVTLITCTPYGINTHRLLVRGSRIDNVVEKDLVVTTDAYQIDKLVVAIFVSVFILIVPSIYMLVKH